MHTEGFIRLVIWLIIVGETLVATGLILVPGNTLSLSWVVYVLVGYLLFYELPLRLAGQDSQMRGVVVVVGMFVINALVFDLLGQLFDLWEVPIIGTVTYDNVVHLTSMPFAICALVWALAMMVEQHYRLAYVPYFVPGFVLMGALSLSAIHELVEMVIDLATGSNAGTSIAPGDIYDTSLDLGYDAIGTVIFVAILVVWRGRHRGYSQAQST